MSNSQTSLSTNAGPEDARHILLPLLRFASWEDRVVLRLVTPMDDEAYWHALCMRLAAEAHLYVPQQPPCSWRRLFRELWPSRGSFVDELRPAGARSVRLEAAVRFRPDAGWKGREQTVSLPLHQRSAMLREQNPGMSREEAVKQIMQASEQGEKGSMTAQVLDFSAGTNGSVLTVTTAGLRTFHFDRVLGLSATQQDVYAATGYHVVLDVVNGTSGAIVAYGQTGAGKTHTVFGPEDDPGVARRAVAFLLEACAARGAEVRMSYVEVYGQEVNNLLSDAKDRRLNQRMGPRYVLDGRLDQPLPDMATFEELLAAGDEKKRSAATAMNERSSRAHALLLLRVRQRGKESLLILADLGGSEKVTKSRAHEDVRCPGGFRGGNEEEDEASKVTWAEYYKARQRVTETSNINKALLVLKRCISALRRGSGRIPFADAKLTQLLQPALGEASRTVVLVCASLENAHAEETAQSLRFGESCRLIEHTQGDEVSAALRQTVGKIDAEIKATEAEIKRKERWERRRTVRRDVISEMNTGGTQLNTEEEMELGGKGAVEFLPDDGKSKQHVIEHEVWGEVLVGAEAENERLAELLEKRRRLLGE